MKKLTINILHSLWIALMIIVMYYTLLGGVLAEADRQDKIARSRGLHQEFLASGE